MFIDRHQSVVVNKDYNSLGLDLSSWVLLTNSSQKGFEKQSRKLFHGNAAFLDLFLFLSQLSPPPSEALRRMHMLACDPGIIAVMNKVVAAPYRLTFIHHFPPAIASHISYFRRFF